MNDHRELARDDECFPKYVEIWRRYLVGWCNMPDTEFERFVDRTGNYSSGFIFHEEPSYFILDYLFDLNGQPLLFQEEPNLFLRWEKVKYQVIYRTIFRDHDFDDWSATDDQWQQAKERVSTELNVHGYQLKSYRENKTA